MLSMPMKESAKVKAHLFCYNARCNKISIDRLLFSSVPWRACCVGYCCFSPIKHIVCLAPSCNSFFFSFIIYVKHIHLNVEASCFCHFSAIFAFFIIFQLTHIHIYVIVIIDVFLTHTHKTDNRSTEMNTLRLLSF